MLKFVYHKHEIMDIIAIVRHDSTSYSSLVVYDLCFLFKNTVFFNKNTSPTPRKNSVFGWPLLNPWRWVRLMAGAFTSPVLKDEVEQLCGSWTTARMRTISLERQLFLKTQEARAQVVSETPWKWDGILMNFGDLPKMFVFCVWLFLSCRKRVGGLMIPLHKKKHGDMMRFEMN